MDVFARKLQEPDNPFPVYKAVAWTDFDALFKWLAGLPEPEIYVEISNKRYHFSNNVERIQFMSGMQLGVAVCRGEAGNDYAG